MEKYIKKLSSLLSTSKEIIVRSGFESEFQELQSALTQIQSTATTILVCGEFKRGKSSFINALLGENICPVDIGVTTAAVSVIRYGDTPKVTRYHGNIVEDGETADLKTETVEYASIQDYVKGSSIDIANTIMLDIEVPNERLKSGLCVIDTPGVGSMDPRHLFLTLYALPKADAIFFMTAAGEPMTETERDFFVHHIAPLNKPSRVLLNIADRFSTDAERDIVIADTVKKFTEANIADITVLPISAEQWIEFNASEDEFAKEIANCETVLSLILEVKQQHEHIMLKTIASEFVLLINETGKRVQEKLTTLQSGKLTEEQAKLQKRIDELSEFQKQIVESNSPLRQKINSIVKEAQKKALAEFSKDSILLSSEVLDKILECDEVYQEGGDKYIVEKINAEIKEISKKLDDILVHARKRVEKEIQIKINEALEGIHAKLDCDKIDATLSIDAISIFGQLGRGAGICGGLAWVGGLIEAPAALIGAASLLTPIGMIMGLGAGAYLTINSMRKNRRKEKSQAIKKSLSPKISIAMNEMKQCVQDNMETFQSQILSVIQKSADEYSKQIKETKNVIITSKGDDKVRQENIIKIQKDLTFIIYVANELKNLPLK